MSPEPTRRPPAVRVGGPLRTSIAIVVRELYEWRWFLLAAPVLGLLARLAPRLPGLAHHETETVHQATLVTLGGLLLVGSLLVIGATMVAQPLAERRISFYFARPLSTAQLWFGKVAAAGATVLLLLLGLVLPTLLLGGAGSILPDDRAHVVALRTPLSAFGEAVAFRFAFQEPSTVGGGAWLALAVGGVLLALVLVHAGASLSASRGPWLLLDLVGLGATLFALWAVRDQLLAHQALGALALVERAFLAGALLVSSVAGWRQLEHGRIDFERGRRRLSLVTWAGFLGLALGAGLYASWVVRPSIDDLRSVERGLLSPEGSHLLVAGPLDGRAGARGAFLLDLASGTDSSPGRFSPARGRFLPGVAAVASAPVYSADGSRLAWSRCRRLVPVDCQVWFADLERGEIEPRASRSAIRAERYFAAVALSSDGSRIALERGRRVDVYQLESGDLLASTRVGHVHGIRFPEADIVRVYADPIEPETSPATALEARDAQEENAEEPVGPGAISITEIDLRSRTARQVGRIEQQFGVAPADWSFDEERLHLQGLTPRTNRVFDARSGRLLFDLRERLGLGADGALLSARFLADGRLVVLVHREGSSRPDRDRPSRDRPSRDRPAIDPSRSAVTPEIATVLEAADRRQTTDLWVLDAAGEIERHLALETSVGMLRARAEIEPGRLLLSSTGVDRGSEPGAADPGRARHGTYWFDADRAELHRLSSDRQLLELHREPAAPGRFSAHLFRERDGAIVRWRVDLDDPEESPPPTELFPASKGASIGHGAPFPH